MKSISEHRSTLRFVENTILFAEEQAPLRAEIFNTSEMTAHCKWLANRSGLVMGNYCSRVLRRLADNEKALGMARQILSGEGAFNTGFPADQEWIQTNFFVMQEQIQKVKSLVPLLDSVLPLQESGFWKGMPRVYDLAVEIVSHTDAQIDIDHLITYVTAYQQIAPLQGGELKSILIMLKLALIENLRRLAVRLAAVKAHQHKRYTLNDKEQLADRVSFRNAISSLRSLDTVDWDNFLDVTNLVEQIFCEERAGIYRGMDFYTRDRYRNEVSNISKRAGTPELDVVRRTVKMANAALENDPADPRSHVGFFLIGKGWKEMEKRLGMRSTGKEKVLKILRRHPGLFYLGGIVCTTCVMAAALFRQVYETSMGTGMALAMVFVLLLSISQLGVMFIDWLIMLFGKPELLPRMDFSEGLPAGHRTLVVVPALLTGKAAIDELLNGLEVRFLANKQAYLHFGLLTDFRDAPQETMRGDETLLQQVKKGIAELNERHGSKDNDIFYLFHRPRKWNPGEQMWMGYERKRGKLMELNGLLRGQGRDNFSDISGDESIFPSIKYVITLDADTLLPRNAATEMIATMAHPLNRAVYDEQKKRVVAGYGILQPRVSINMMGTKGSLYQRLNAGIPDMDPYTRAAPDIYQDVFDEGSFIGKGIYEVDILLKAMEGRFPENRILSHDLLEGSYARSGMLTDVKLYETSSDFWSDMKRRHRWVRGDWQIAAWIGPWVPGKDGKWVKNPISILSRWKIFDNLRHSLVPAAHLLLLLLGWTILPHAWFWTLTVILVSVFPALKIFLGKMAEQPSGMLSWKYWKIAAGLSSYKFILNVYDLVCLPYQVLYTLDAILLACWRMLVSRRKLLEWVPFGSVEHSTPDNLLQAFLYMWRGPVAALLMTIAIVIIQPLSLWVAAPLLILWLVSPAIAWKFNQPSKTIRASITAAQHVFLRKIARKTWSFFEEFIGADSNWLPPDHYQEYPVEKLANYTSPTNMGLALLANLSACDFGYITAGEFIKRTANTLNTMGCLERYKGHFYNWYDNKTLNPALPRYVSTVDSGNLAGHLLTLQQGALDLPGQPVFGKQLFEGMQDTLELVMAETETDTLLLRECRMHLSGMIKAEMNSLTQLKSNVEELERMIAALPGTLPPAADKGLYWLQLLSRQCVDVLTELQVLAPWLWLPDPPAAFAALRPDNIPTLSVLADMTITLLSESSKAATQEEKEWLAAFHVTVMAAKDTAVKRIASLERITVQCMEFTDMEYEFLYNRSQQLLSIGYQVEDGCMDANCYDVLASEARLASFVAIGQGKLPKKSWFVARRLLLDMEGSVVLLSANGTMFEYLMPLLVMPTYENTLLDHAYRTAVKEQIRYGKKHGIPWGVSESGYSTMDVNLNYQYKVFGVPALSLKRGRKEEDKVIAPYAGVLALMVNPGEACVNLEQLSTLGFEGKYGFYEAIDYMPSRLLSGQSNVVVRSFMVHHQGMSLLSLAYLLLDQPMQKRFEFNPQIRSSLLLLQERIPKETAVYFEETPAAQTDEVLIMVEEVQEQVCNNMASDTVPPEVQLLSNGRYHVMVTSTGCGYSQWEDIAITHWRKNDYINCGVFSYLKDVEDDTQWSVTCQPAHKGDGTYETIFAPGSAVYHHTYKELKTVFRIIVAPEEDMELRQLTIHNHSQRKRTIEVISYVEVMLDTLEGKNSFEKGNNSTCLQKEVLHNLNAVFCGRQAHMSSGRLPWMFHVMKVYDADIIDISYETEEGLFSDPGKAGSDPEGALTIVAIRYLITIEPGATATADIYIGIGENRKLCETLAYKCQDRQQAAHIFDLTRRHSQTVLKQINVSAADAQLFRKMAGLVVFSELTFSNEMQEYHVAAIDGPFILLRMSNAADLEVLEQFVQMLAFWRLHGLSVSLMIWNEDQGSYRHFLQRLILESITSGIGSEMLNRHKCGIFIKAVEKMSDDDISLFQRAACVIIAGEWHPSAKLVRHSSDEFAYYQLN